METTCRLERMVTFWQSHWPSSSWRPSNNPASTLTVNPHRSISSYRHQHLSPTHKSILGQPPTSDPKSLIVHPPTTETDGFQAVLSKRNRRPLRAEHSQQSIDIEVKTFRISRKNTIHGITLQIRNKRPLYFAQYWYLCLPSPGWRKP